MTIDSILNRQMHFVTGKGGVGKSTLSCLFANYFADRGLTTLLIQINASDSHSDVLGSAAIGPHLQQLGPHLWAFNADPQECVQEYLLMKVRSRSLYKVLFNNGLARSFLNFLPSLHELAMLGKIWFHANERVGDTRRFDRIVVDCPATGHGLHFLKVPQNTYEAVKVGPIAQEARKMAEQIINPQQSALHIVTWPEELPVSEALELMQEVQTQKIAAPGILIVNGVQEKLFEVGTPPLPKMPATGHSEPAWSALVKLVEARATLEQQQEQEIDRLQAAQELMPQLELPRVAEGKISRRAHSQLARAFSAAIQ